MSSQDNISPDSPSGSNSKDAMFEPKPKPKMIRVLTVLAYVLSVSMAAILLSIYYIFMWDGKPHLGAIRSSNLETMEPQNYSERHTAVFSYTSNSYELSKAEHTNKTANESMDTLRVVNNENGIIINKNDKDEYNATSIRGDNRTEGYNNRNIRKLPQQLTQTAIEPDEEVTVSSTTSTTPEHVSVTWPDDFDDFDKSGIFFKKMFGIYDY